MPPVIHAILGPLKGTSITLTEEDLTIGRDRSSQLPISDLHLSRKHCVIKKEAGEYQLHDLSSMNGIFVNAIPIRERILKHGDRIEFGASMFVFLSQEDNLQELTLMDETVSDGSAITTELDSGLNRVRDTRDVDLLLQISAAIGCIQDLESLGRKLLELVFEVVPAQRGAILLIESSSETLTPVWRLTKLSDSQPVLVSRSIAERVLREKIGILARNTEQTNLRIQSLLCVPFVLFNRVLGILYLDTINSPVHLNENHLKLTNAIASVAAPAFQNSLDMEQLKGSSRRLQAEMLSDRKMIGESASMKKVLQLIMKISSADTTALISGETGTGKELAARAIHENSRRTEQPFVAINCAALPETLLETELFGYEKGAFTGALAQKKGKLEVANGGSIFLDEIAELAPALQAKILRFLQEREFERVGGTRTIKVDLRLIAATNKNLQKEVEKGSFRQDLYYRLNVVELRMPSLRDLGDDILLLAQYFVSKLCKKLPRRVHGISLSAQECLRQYDWPGNVRELENVIERAILLGSTDAILPEDLPESLLAVQQSENDDSTYFHDAVNGYKKQLIKKALEETSFDYNEAANRLGIHPTHLYRLVRNLRLNDLLKK